MHASLQSSEDPKMAPLSPPSLGLQEPRSSLKRPLLNSPIEKFIHSCFEDHITKINVITGKGSRSKNFEDPYQSKDLSLLKHSVPNYIKQNENLMNKILKIDYESVENPSKGNFNIILKKKSG